MWQIERCSIISVAFLAARREEELPLSELRSERQPLAGTPRSSRPAQVAGRCTTEARTHPLTQLIWDQSASRLTLPSSQVWPCAPPTQLPCAPAPSQRHLSECLTSRAHHSRSRDSHMLLRQNATPHTRRESDAAEPAPLRAPHQPAPDHLQGEHGQRIHKEAERLLNTPSRLHSTRSTCTCPSLRASRAPVCLPVW